jgi:hypothetical protein
MITLKSHIEMMEWIQSGKSPSDYIESMKPLESLDFSRHSLETYPIKDNLKQPQGGKRFYTNVESLVLGQFIMLEQIITGKTKLADHLIDLELAKLIIRPIKHEVFDNSDPVLEQNNESDILNMDVREVYWVLENFIESRNKTLFKDFSGVFYDVNEDEEGDDEEDVVRNRTSEMLFNQQWYWYSIVRMLANEDITKYEEIYMLPMNVVLPEMSYLAQKSKIESTKQRESQALRKL